MERDNEVPPVTEEKPDTADAKEQKPKPKKSDDHEFNDWAAI